jgi:hypothetical protein
MDSTQSQWRRVACCFIIVFTVHEMYTTHFLWRHVNSSHVSALPWNALLGSSCVTICIRPPFCCDAKLFNLSQQRSVKGIRHTQHACALFSWPLVMIVMIYVLKISRFTLEIKKDTSITLCRKKFRCCLPLDHLRHLNRDRLLAF